MEKMMLQRKEMKASKCRETKKEMSRLESSS